MGSATLLLFAALPVRLFLDPAHGVMNACDSLSDSLDSTVQGASASYPICKCALINGQH